MLPARISILTSPHIQILPIPQVQCNLLQEAHSDSLVINSLVVFRSLDDVRTWWPSNTWIVTWTKVTYLGGELYTQIMTNGKYNPSLLPEPLNCSVVSNSLQPHRLRPTRFLRQWNFPGKNTRAGCHFLLQGILPTQALNPCLLCLLQWQAVFILYHWAIREPPKTL